MKPDTTTAMRQLIRQIRAATPFDLAEARICDGPCNGCSLKLLDYLESELEGWQARLDQGVRPNFGDLSQLANSGRKIHRILQHNGLLDGTPTDPTDPTDPT
ncbi:hypothetical protein Ga0074115_11020 [endosymbiont of Ridgeia piscesae]|jgi:hypothetical protein|uniref:Uncharacterized protein n=1 Tax=endosymbiont of Ridgeia piscesae TaxID=54398 RepID=A0A0T5YW43_9GAMM|nr:hypothetical protein [endosymbiont of Ridgeia piscesae]KRT54808.1 hypothetical protein Ga0074115_11020 [endosymbiont of Ridgeia piscesae]